MEAARRLRGRRKLRLLAALAATVLAGSAGGQVHSGTDHGPRSANPQPFLGGLRTQGGITFDADGQTAWVALREGVPGTPGRRPLHLHSARLEEGTWAISEPLYAGTWSDYQPALAADGSQLYFTSTRPPPGATASASADLWYLERAAVGWREPRHLTELATPALDGFAAPAADGTLYFVSGRQGGLGELDIWRSEPDADGIFGKPVNERILNSPYSDSDVWVEPRERFIVLSRYTDFAASVDLFIAFRQGDGWTVPRPLAAVNEDGWEESPAVTPDGRTFLYSLRGTILQVDLCDLLETGDPARCEGTDLVLVPPSASAKPAGQPGDPEQASGW